MSKTKSYLSYVQELLDDGFAIETIAEMTGIPVAVLVDMITTEVLCAYHTV